MADQNNTNWGIIGHEWAVALLRQSIAGGRAGHAYLISGPAQIGKALLALRLAQVLNCEMNAPDPCLTCRSCGRIARGNHPDIRISGLQQQGAGLKADEAARQRDLKIDTVREWQSDITLRPYEGRRRIFILHDAEKLSEAAANAMLKTLEEPPPYATILLVANTAGDMLPTIVSRCQALRLRPVPRSTLAAALVHRGMVEEDAQLLAAWSGGRAGWALHMIADPEALAARQAQLDELAELAGMPRSAGLRWAEERAKEYRGGEQAAVFAAIELWQSWWRDVLLVAAGFPAGVTHIDRRAALAKAAARYDVTEIHSFINRLVRTSRQLRENVNPQLALENVLLHLPAAQ